VKDFNGVVVQNISEVEVECFPQFLPERISVDISGLAQIGATVHIRDLQVSSDVAVHHEADDVIVVISASKEEAEVTEEAATLEPEVIERGKKEEDVD
jgi:large subunit ribosomal protein L25